MNYVAILGVIVGALSILTTVLLVWQVIASINIEKTINRRIRKSIDSLKEDMENKIQKNTNATIANVLIHTAMALKKDGEENDFTLAIQALMIALENNTENVNMCIWQFLDTYKDKRHKITPATYEDLGILIYESKIKEDDKKKLMDFLGNQELLGFDSM